MTDARTEAPERVTLRLIGAPVHVPLVWRGDLAALATALRGAGVDLNAFAKHLDEIPF